MGGGVSGKPGAQSTSVIARLLLLTEPQVDQLTRDGVLPSAGRGQYELVPAVQGYVRYLKSKSLLEDGDGAGSALRLSSKEVAEWLGVTDRRVRQMAQDGTLPAAVDGLYPLRECVQARIRYLEDLAAGRVGTDTDEQKKQAQIELLQQQRAKMQADQQRIEIDLATRRGQLIPSGAVRDAMTRMVRVLSEGASALPDLLEERLGLDSEAIAQVTAITDKWRLELYRATAESFTGSSLDEPAATPGEERGETKKRPGRPRKRSGDSFTPSLI